MDENHDETIRPFVGRKLTGWSKDPNQSKGPVWLDDEPLRLTFDDGSVLVISATGWHQSGVLYIESEPAATSA